MALVTNLEPSTKGRQSVHQSTRCLYTIVTSAGSQYLQLDTIGTEAREIPDKVSQSIQFDRQAAGQLLQLLYRTFPELEGNANSISAVDEESADAEDEGDEGRTLFRLHRLRERQPRLVKRKKEAVYAASGRLNCEVCDFDFSEVYGTLGDGFAECHHRIPLAELIGATRTRLSDLAIVCANCHRMLHRRPVHTIAQLREVVHARDVPSN